MHYRPLSLLRTAAVRDIPSVRLTDPLADPPTDPRTGRFTGRFTGQGPQFAELTGAYWLDSYGHGGDGSCECGPPAAETAPLPPTPARARALRTVPSPTHRSM
jgi:hypothetical protein